jgi:DNA-binding transcriptional LysR family regulator
LLDLRRIQTLIEVARHGSFSAAADALNFTQSAVSQQVAALELQAGTRLLYRNPISLTEAGEVVCARGQRAVAQLRAARVELEQLEGLREGSLRLATFASAGSQLLPHALAAFRRQHPHVAVTLAQHEVEESEASIRAGTLDLALTFDYSVAPSPPDPMLSRAPLVREPVCIAMARDHRLAREPRVRLDDLVNEPWVRAVHAGLALELLSEAIGASGFTPEVTFEGDDFETVLGLVAAGFGVAVIPELALGTADRVVVRRIDGDPLTRSIYATTLATDHPPAAVPAMKAALRDAVRRLRRAAPTGAGASPRIRKI